MHLTYKIMEIVCDNCDKDGCECINCTIASKIFELLDNYIIEERDATEEEKKINWVIGMLERTLRRITR